MNYGFQSGQNSNDNQSSFADALARAQEVAAKFSKGSDSDTGGSVKRPFDEIGDNQPDLKKMNTGSTLNDPIGAQLRNLMDPHRQSNAAAVAAAAASQINQKLGSMAGGVGGPGVPPMGMNSPHMGNMGPVINEEFQVPDRMVGLIIGKGGEQIASIQAESGCKVQFAPDSNGMPERNVTLTGSPEAISKARELVERVVQRAQGGADGMMGNAGNQGMPVPSGGGGANDNVLEVSIPGPKVGLVIGKGGDTIKQLQERAGVKMVMVQDSNTPSFSEKPLRIMGDPIKCQRAKEMVMDLITEKELESRGFNPGANSYGGNDYGGQSGGPQTGRNNAEIVVPKIAVGVIIGKGGDMIKRIQGETGARVQFNTSDPPDAPERVCMVTGPAEKVQLAASMITDLVQSTMERQQGGGGRGRGRGFDQGSTGSFDDRSPGNRGGFGGNFGGNDTTQFTVPAEKCGLVIGRGGETIREINRQSGAYVELQRGAAPNPNEKIFNVRGDGGQIQHAIQLIAEKAGVPPPSNNGPGPNGPGGPPGQHNQGGPPMMGAQNGFNQFGGQQPQQPGGPGPQNPYGGGQQMPAQNRPVESTGWGDVNSGQPQPQQQYNTPQGWGNAYQQWQNPTTQEPAQAPAPAPAPQQPAVPQQNANASGQPDYSAAWAEYYRQQGMPYHAQAILAQAQAQQQPQQQQQQPMQPQ